MKTGGDRESGRLALAIPIEVAGADCLGADFLERTHTLVIGPHGGKIALERKLSPHQEILIRCLATGREVEATIVGLIGKGTGGYHYGIRFGGDDSIWGLDFQPLTDPDGAVCRVLLECLGCKNREVVCLDDFELEVLEVNGQLSRSCKRCRDVSLWRKSGEDMPDAEADVPASAQPGATELVDKRREPRRAMRIAACVRTARCGQDMVKTRSVSRNGLCFTSPWEYLPGETIEVAVPYSPGGGNIFLSAKIVRLQLLSTEGTRIYGVAFQHIKE